MTDNPRSTAHIAGHPLHPMIVPLPITLLVGGFVCDLGYLIAGNPVWAVVAMWSIGAGIVAAAVAAVLGLIDFIGDSRIRALSDAWQHFLANGAAVIVALVNFYLRYSDGAEAAALPWGLLLSAVTTLLLAFSGWKGGELVFRHRVAVLDDSRRGLP